MPSRVILGSPKHIGRERFGALSLEQLPRTRFYVPTSDVGSASIPFTQNIALPVSTEEFTTNTRRETLSAWPRRRGGRADHHRQRPRAPSRAAPAVGERRSPAPLHVPFPTDYVRSFSSSRRSRHGLRLPQRIRSGLPRASGEQALGSGLAMPHICVGDFSHSPNGMRNVAMQDLTMFPGRSPAYWLDFATSWAQNNALKSTEIR